MSYCTSIFRTKRWKTRVVHVGTVAVGGDNPVRIQSMTTSPTHDVEQTVEQIMRLADEGCEIARVTVQGKKEAKACEGIKNTLIQKGYTIPLVADIHFYPPAAMSVVDFVDKVRINPGNYADKRAQFQTIEYTDESYAKELERIEEKFTPLVLKCKQLGRAMRIGTNHGSLSDRIMNRFGDTAQGMVESAIEYTHVCRKHDFHDIIYSMKASNTRVMIQAYRLLVAEMTRLGWNYPLHLGVTEAGEGEDGRVKSAIGIGSLLLDGIGDTIRVSLTEDPWYEIDPCKRLVSFARSKEGKGIAPFEEKQRSIEEHQRRLVAYPEKLSMHRDGTVALSVDFNECTTGELVAALGCRQKGEEITIDRASADFLLVNEKPCGEERQQLMHKLGEIGVRVVTESKEVDAARVTSLRESVEKEQKSRFSPASLGSSETQPILSISDEGEELWPHIEKLNPACILLSPVESRLHYCRKFFDWLKRKELSVPVVLRFFYDVSWEDLVIQASSEYGALLADGLGEGILIEGDYPIADKRSLSFAILQGCRMRTIKTEFISCPSCGRTLFNLQEVSERIRQRTSHLPGVKIAIMGCIVNGPGEMADADFGYVGSLPGKVDLYVGKERVKKGIDFSEADDELVALIKEHGRWEEPQEVDAHAS